MSPETKDLLLSAWRENRLAALHIDLQDGFGVDEKHDLRRSVKYVVKILRQTGIPNIWSLAKGESYKDRMATVGNFDRELYSIYGFLASGIGARGDEPAVAKTENSALYAPDTPLNKYLKDQKKDTLLIGGVNAHVCVAQTIRDAILSDHYNIVVMLDCTNLSEGETPVKFTNFLRRTCNDDVLFTRRFHSATSLEIVDTLNVLSPS